MTVIVILSVFLVCFLQCYAGETANICQPGHFCVPSKKCELKINEETVLYPCKRDKYICCPKLKNTIERSTQRYEPFNTIKTTTHHPNFYTVQEDNRIKKTTSNYITKDGSYILNRKTDYNPQIRDTTRDVYTGNYNGGKNILINNKEAYLHLNRSDNLLNGENEPNICEQNFSCVPIPECHFRFGIGEVIYPCNKNRTNVCCPRLQHQDSIEKTTQKYEPFNTINPSIFQNDFHDNDNTNRVKEVSNIKDTLKFNKFTANNTALDFENYTGTNKILYNSSIITPEEYSLDYNSNNNALTSTNKEINYVSNSSNSDKPKGVKISEQGFNKNKNSETRPASSYESDQIIFDIPGNNEKNNMSYTNRPALVNNFNTNNNTKNPMDMTRKDIFSKNCGITLAHDKITGGQIAEMGQFPWMALLGFKHSSGHRLQFLCGGSLITTRHVLTAAHCIIENHQLELRSIRFGEYNLTTERDCVQFGKDEVCADHYVDVGVDRVTIHPEFNRTSLKNDIAIIRIKKDVEISDYINTICLPFDKDYSTFNMAGQNFTVSGWGKLSTGDLFGTNVIQYAKVTIWDPLKCNNSLPSEVKPLSKTQLCANGANSEDSCKGDSGGPLINVTLDKDLEIRHIQFGVVSFGTGTCGDKNLPTIYTRVDQYLKWILQNVT